jgi:hypothetical protein
LGAPLPDELPVSAFGRRHVALALARKMSPLRTWLAREKWRAGTLWRCEKIAYRSAIRGAGPAATTAAVWTGRVVRIPILFSRAIAIFARALGIVVNERLQRKYLSGFAGVPVEILPAAALPPQKS